MDWHIEVSLMLASNYVQSLKSLKSFKIWNLLRVNLCKNRRTRYKLITKMRRYLSRIFFHRIALQGFLHHITKNWGVEMRLSQTINDWTHFFFFFKLKNWKIFKIAKFKNCLRDLGEVRHLNFLSRVRWNLLLKSCEKKLEKNAAAS